MGAPRVIHNIMAIIFWFWFSIYALNMWDHGNGFNKPHQCAADAMSFHPLEYETDEELSHYLTYQGTVNVSARFKSIIKTGSILFTVVIVHMLYCWIV